MKSFEYVIKDEVGIHARPAGLLVKAAQTCDSVITITRGDKSANAARLMAIMSMGVKHGDTVIVSIEGGDEEANAAKMEDFFANNL